MSKFLVTLANEIKRHKCIKADHQLRAKEWNKTCFARCAEIIHDGLHSMFNQEEMLQYGTSISYKTLQSIFNSEYRIKYPMDPRSLNTLTKLVRFIGYNSWDEFTEDVEQSADIDQLASEEQVNLLSFVRGAVRTSFNALHKGSANGPLTEYFAKGKSAHKALEEIIVHHGKEKNTIANPYNPSTYEILDIHIESVNTREARVKTQEYWLLCWWNESQGKYVKRIKDINDHSYILTKHKGRWKIKSDVTLSDRY